MQGMWLMLFLLVAIAFGNSDIDALLELKKGFRDDPAGLVLDSWNSKSLDSNGCPQNWYGILCGEGSVTSIILDNAGLVGEFNFPAIGGLKMLRNLSVANNQFEGSILQIGQLELLEFLDLSLNKFNGLLPSNFVELRNLVYLNLSSNEFEGTLPVGFDKLSKLKYLDLNTNNFSGDIMHIFSQMGSVVHVDLSRNRFSGTPDFGLGDDSFLSSIKYLNVSHNSLTGELFAHDGMPYLDSLEVFDASNNKLEGNIPSFTFVVSLRILRLERNQLSGLLPQTLLKESSMMLSELDLSQNKIEGPIGSITSVTLRKLNISSNKLSGALPLKIGHCAIVDLSNNKLSGNLSRIQYWGNYVEVIQLSSNSLIGTLPNETTQFLRLTELKVSNNSLEGVLSPILGTYPELKEIDLSFNRLSGFLLPSFFTSTKLTKLNLSNNKFSGPIPVELRQGRNNPSVSSKDSSMVYLDLSCNNLSGVIPSKLSKLHNLAYLNLCSNKLEGTIPNDLPALRGFNVSFNNLSGVVPDNLIQFPESSFHPGNSLLILPKSRSSPKDASDFGLGEHQSHKKSAIRIALIASLVTGALVMAFVGMVIYYMVRRQKERTSKQNEARGIVQVSSSLSTREGPNRNLEAIGSSQGGSADDGGNIDAFTKKAKDLCQPELVKNDEDMLSPMSFVSASNPSSSISPQFENPGSLSVSSPDKLGGYLNLFDGSLVLTGEELSCAPAEIIGRSCHGTLYKATLDSGHELAVKWLREGITKGKKEFAREVRKLGTIKHPNLVSIQGYYLGPKEHERLIVTNFINAHSLDIYLHEADKRNLQSLSLDERLRVAVEVARCLNFLHNEKAIPHGNLKSTNILLEAPDRNVRLTDYSLHRILTAAGTAEQVLNAGALGYMPPEFARSSSKPSPSLKSDVYAFGVVLLELTTGRKSGEILSQIPGAVDLTDWVRFLASENRSNECFDRFLVEQERSERASRILDEMLKVALRCILPASERPDMETVFADLSSIR
ncbi:probable inactive receptor kinase At5g10020 isoform X1 [Arachis ipaensis]|uniref:probable inactive receptor kinase At5g10020 isoform X1 n=1 Tax=Arachis ipaensis TaxID=130454 RepID=UPI0007AFA732|nr:probable inactive receptor kinase At5g10020 isoform X1 [Arachis ipaensis]XP_020962768.1 probable inactive receptor kinase At5g10020 isoform X1 [Arachis ipaensis]